MHPSLEPLLLPIGELTPHPQNPHNGDVDAIMESIRVNGMYRPLEAQMSTGRILCGNQTYAALMELGATLAPVVPLDVTDAAALRIMLGDNELARLGNDDQGQLAGLLVALRRDDPLSLLGTGWDDDKLTRLLRTVTADKPLQGDDRPAPTRCKCCGNLYYPE